MKFNNNIYIFFFLDLLSSVITWLYSAALYFIFVYMVIKFYIMELQNESIGDMNLNKLIQLTYHLIALSCFIILPLLHWNWSRNLSKFFRMWLQLQVGRPLFLIDAISPLNLIYF